MEALIFAVTSEPSAGCIELEPCPGSCITPAMWADLAAQVAHERTLMPCAAATLARRAEEGFSVAAVWEGQIVSHLSLVPVGRRKSRPGAPHAWASYCAAAGLRAARLPSVDAYLFATGWTAPAWRGKHISECLREPLLERCGGERSLVLGGMVGMVSPVLAGLGWEILGWTALPFLSSLIGMPRAGLEACGVDGWRLPAGLERYEGPPDSLDAFAHAWSQYCYFGVSDAQLANRLNGELADLCGGDLHGWRLAVLEVFRQPGALHSLAWLP